MPIIAPIRKDVFEIYEATAPELTFDFDFFGALLTNPKLIRNVLV